MAIFYRVLPKRLELYLAPASNQIDIALQFMTTATLLHYLHYQTNRLLFNML